jgi:hypothetical protein
MHSGICISTKLELLPQRLIFISLDIRHDQIEMTLIIKQIEKDIVRNLIILLRSTHRHRLHSFQL